MIDMMFTVELTVTMLKFIGFNNSRVKLQRGNDLKNYESEGVSVCGVIYKGEQYDDEKPLLILR